MRELSHSARSFILPGLNMAMPLMSFDAWPSFDKERQVGLSVGIFGGTFNPIHLGHLAVARRASQQLALDQLLFVPTGEPPHKRIAGQVSAVQRLEMIRLAVQDDVRFSVSDIEIRRQGKSYTLDTVREFAGAYPASTRLFFVLGDDCVENLHRWKGVDELMQLVRFVSANRLGAESDPSIAQQIIPLKMAPVAISSSFLRESIARGQSVREWIPQPVIDYIARHKLYGVV